MPGKNVHFAHTNIIYYPPTSGLSIPLLSPVSSGGPLTPPSRTTFPPQSSVFPRLSPYSIPFSPSPEPACLHVLLQLSSSPLLNFDLRQSPSTITSHHRVIQLRALSEPATQPGLAALTIVIPHLPWSATVYPSHRGAFVSVDDVLEQLHAMLCMNISAEEFHLLPSDTDRYRVTVAYEQRYRRIRGSRKYEDEKSGGVRRIDFLMGHIKFMGLSPSATWPDAWVLHTI
ncbi:hypothetical protein C0995_000312 [Termitomyces sp. Mi166|nr:hypothetical protein C0995_000312 [Termitomyces sp. Mi166\